MWLERRRNNGDPVWDLMCCDVDYSVPPLPSLQIYHCLIYPPHLSIPPHTTSYLYISRIRFPLCLIYFRWRCNMRRWCCWCDIRLQHPTSFVSHNLSFYPFHSRSIHPSISPFLYLFTKNNMWYEEEMLVWCRLQLPTVSVSHNLSLYTCHPLYSHSLCFSYVDLVRGGFDKRISFFWCNLVMLIATSHHFCPAEFIISWWYPSPLSFSCSLWSTLYLQIQVCFREWQL